MRPDAQGNSQEREGDGGEGVGGSLVDLREITAAVVHVVVEGLQPGVMPFLEKLRDVAVLAVDLLQGRQHLLVAFLVDRRHPGVVHFLDADFGEHLAEGLFAFQFEPKVIAGPDVFSGLGQERLLLFRGKGFDILVLLLVAKLLEAGLPPAGVPQHQILPVRDHFLDVFRNEALGIFPDDLGGLFLHLLLLGIEVEVHDDFAGLGNEERVGAAGVPLLGGHPVQLKLQPGLGALVVQPALLGLDDAVVGVEVLYELDVLQLVAVLLPYYHAVRTYGLVGAGLYERHGVFHVVVGDYFPLLLLGQGKNVVVGVKGKDRDDRRQSHGRESDAENRNAGGLHGRDLAVGGEAAVNEKARARHGERQGVAQNLGHDDHDELQDRHGVEFLEDQLDDLQQTSHDHHESQDHQGHDEGQKNGIQYIEIQDPHAEGLSEDQSQQGPLLLLLFVSH